MATNFFDRQFADDVPPKSFVRETARRDKERSRDSDNTQDRVDAYLQNRPSASWAEAEFYSRNKK